MSLTEIIFHSTWVVEDKGVERAERMVTDGEKRRVQGTERRICHFHACNLLSVDLVSAVHRSHRENFEL